MLAQGDSIRTNFSDLIAWERPRSRYASCLSFWSQRTPVASARCRSQLLKRLHCLSIPCFEASATTTTTNRCCLTCPASWQQTTAKLLTGNITAPSILGLFLLWGLLGLNVHHWPLMRLTSRIPRSGGVFSRSNASLPEDTCLRKHHPMCWKRSGWWLAI